MFVIPTGVAVAIFATSAGGTGGVTGDSDLMPKIIVGIIMACVGGVVAVRALFDYMAEKANKNKLEAAESAAMLIDGISERIEEIKKIDADEYAKDNLMWKLDTFIEQHVDTINLQSMLKNNYLQLNHYQQQTRSRASWSFIFAIIAMLAGLGFLFWGGAILFSQSQWEHIVSGSALSTIGGGVSAFITATFLKVHKSELKQLNHYFRQPVLRSYALMAVYFAELIDDEELRKKSYEKTINKMIELMQDDKTDGSEGDDSDDSENTNSETVSE